MLGKMENMEHQETMDKQDNLGLKVALNTITHSLFLLLLQDINKV
jgi:hypothetical protein